MNILMLVSLLSKLRELDRHDRWTRQQLETYQAEALRRLSEYAYAHSPFYRRFHRGLEDRPLHELPVLTKAMMMENFDELVTDRAVRIADVERHLTTLRGDERFLGRYWVNATSGSPWVAFRVWNLLRFRSSRDSPRPVPIHRLPAAGSSAPPSSRIDTTRSLARPSRSR